MEIIELNKRRLIKYVLIIICTSLSAQKVMIKVLQRCDKSSSLKCPTILNLKFDNSFPYKDHNLVCKTDDMELQMNLN